MYKKKFSLKLLDVIIPWVKKISKDYILFGEFFYESILYTNDRVGRGNGVGITFRGGWETNDSLEMFNEHVLKGKSVEELYELI